MKRLNVFKSLAVLFVFSLSIWGAFPSAALGAVPQLINFQGVVKDSAGNTPAVDMLGVTFTIYDAPLGGVTLWTETQSITIVAGGLFSVLLGSTNPIPDSVFADTVRWLGIKVETDPEMLPRQQLVSVGYAYRVNSIDGALGGTINGTINAPGMSSKIRFHYNDVSEFPAPTTYHGMFAHAHNQGAAYYAHAGQWVRLADSAHPHSSLAASDLSPNPALNVDADGNVGIGTTSPTEKLDVNGNIAIRNSNALKIFSDGVGLNFTNAPGAFGTLDMQKTGDLNPSVRLGHSNFPARAFTIMTGNGTGATTERITVLPTGEVGIGTTSPAKKLDVAGSIKTSDTLFASNISSNSPLSLQAPAGTTRMFIHDLTGYVGIGTTSPVGRLHVEGGDAFIGTSPAPFSASHNLYIGNTSGETQNTLRLDGFSNNLYVIANSAPGATTGAGIQFRTAPAQAGEIDRMIIDPDGNVGIGTTNPFEKLHVAGGSIRVNAGDDGILYLGDNTHNTAIVTNSSGLQFHHFSAFPTGIMTLTSGANVGIGTTSPGASNLLELSSATKGFVLPRMTKAQRDAIVAPVAGMMVYQTNNTPGLRVYNGINWMRFTETVD